MGEYSEECLRTFLKDQGQLFDEPVAETLEAAFGKLDQMLETLESSDVSLEDSFRLYKEGMELLNECSQKIDRVEKKMLQMNEDGTFREF